MFNLIDIITIGSILILLFFLFILFIIERSFAKPGIYLKTVLLIALFILLLDELIYLKQYDLVLWSYPIIIGALFSIYPVMYIYSRALVFYRHNSKVPANRDSHGVFSNGKDNSRPHLLFFLGLPFIVFILLSLLYYPLDYNTKIRFIDFHLAESSSDLLEFRLFQYFVIPAYYLQTAFYMIITLKLISVVINNTKSNPWELLIVRYIMVYVICVVIYESLIIINSFVLDNNVVLLQTIEMLLTLLLVSAGLYVGFNQSLILLQSRINRYSNKLEIRNNKPDTESILLDIEKQEIKEAIENYFVVTKIYLDPNLRLENLSKKIHIPVKKISSAINEAYGKNFIGFINDFRISEAKKIISDNHHGIKIDNVYTKVGFNSRSAFNRVFKLVTGITPAEYITSLKEEYKS